MRMLALLAIKLRSALAMLGLAALALFVTIGLLVLGVKGIGGIGSPTFLGPVSTGPSAAWRCASSRFRSR
jgi:hypothetical protein